MEVHAVKLALFHVLKQSQSTKGGLFAKIQ
jgi:hypothetical protein